MTLIAGLKGDGLVYLAADSSITFDGPGESPHATTATGSPIADHGSGTVTDGLWKLVTIAEDVVGTFTGNLEDARRLFAATRTALLAGVPVPEAIQSGVISTAFDDPLMALFAFNLDGEPLLYHMHNLGAAGPVVREVLDNSCIVSPSALMSRICERALDARVEFEPGREFLAAFMVQLQTIARREELETQSIAGLFSGAYWDGEHMNWQADMHYHLYDSANPDPTATHRSFMSMVREGMWIVGSDELGATRYHPARVPPDSFLDRWGSFFIGYVDYGRFDYLGFCDSAADRAVMVEMRKHLDGSGVYFVIDKARLLRHIRKDIEEQLYSKVSDEADFRFLLSPMFPMQETPPPGGYPGSWNDLDLEIERLYATLPDDQARIAIDLRIRDDPRESKWNEDDGS